MKLQVIPSQFETRVVLTDKYGDILCYLQPDGDGYWKIPSGSESQILLDVDDVLYVQEIETEID